MVAHPFFRKWPQGNKCRMVAQPSVKYAWWPTRVSNTHGGPAVFLKTATGKQMPHGGPAECQIRMVAHPFFRKWVGTSVVGTRAESLNIGHVNPTHRGMEWALSENSARTTEQQRPNGGPPVFPKTATGKQMPHGGPPVFPKTATGKQMPHGGPPECQIRMVAYPFF